MAQNPGHRRACIDVFTNIQPYEIEWRVQRVAIFLRLLNATVCSYQHVALMSLNYCSCEWYQQALADIRLIFPCVVIRRGECLEGPCLFSNGIWSQEGKWCSLHPYGMFTDLLGQRYWSKYWDVDDDLKHAIVRGHIKSLPKELRHILVREHSTNVFLRVQSQAIANPSGKLHAKPLPLISLALARGCT